MYDLRNAPGRLAAAEERMRRVLEWRRKWLGERHPETVVATSNAVSPRANDSISACLSFGFMRPCTSPMRMPGRAAGKALYTEARAGSARRRARRT